MKKVPNLRFPEFEDNWKMVTVPEMLRENKGAIKIGPFGSALKKEYYVEQGIKVYAQENVFNKNFNIGNYYITNEKYQSLKSCELEPGDLVVSMMGTIGSCAIFPSGAEKGIMNSHLLRLQFKEEYDVRVIENLLKNSYSIQKQILRLSVGSIMDGLSSSVIKELEFTLPSKEEQKKIASFFSLIDKKIELQTEKVEELKNYKKGIMQKIFSQELRFKDENGNEYPKWEEVSLHQIGATYTGLSGKTKADFGFGHGRFVTYINVFNNTLAKQVAEQVNVSEKENQNLVLKGDLLFTTSSETPNEVGMVSCWNYEMQNLYLNSFCFGYRIHNQDSYLPIFLAYMLRSGEYRKKISILAQGSTRYNISKTELMKMKVQCPCMEEQQKIVALLLDLESKVDHEQNKLNEFIQYKKGLLQQMFI